MRKVILLTGLLLAVLTVQAQHDNLVNLSAEWIRTPARNAATDAGDAVVYNPAGLVKLENGFRINIGNQSMFRKPSHTFDMGMGMGEQTYTQEGNDLFLPNLYMTWKKGRFALFSGMFIAGGGATANYPNGSFNTELIGLQSLMAAQGAYGMYTEQMLKASSFYLPTTLGGSYAINEQISFSVAGRFLNGTNRTRAGLTLTASPFQLPDTRLELNTRETASGFGGVFAVMVQANPKLRFTGRYETAVKMEFETETNTDDFGITADGSTSRRDLPGVVALGVAYAATPKVVLYGDVNHYMQSAADWGSSTPVTLNTNYATLAGDATSYTTAATFQTGEKLLLSIGGGYTNFRYNRRDDYFTKAGAFETAPDDNFNLNAGMSYRVSPSVTMTLAYMHTFYKEQEIKGLMAQPLDVTVRTQNSLHALAVGVDLKF